LAASIIIEKEKKNPPLSNDRAKYYFKFLIDKSIEEYGEVPLFIQYTIMYDLQWMFAISSVNKILTIVEIKQLRKQLHEIIQYIDDKVIYDQNDLTDILKANILFFKYKNQKNTPEYKELENTVVKKLKLNTVYIDIYEIVDNTLYVLGDLHTILKNTVDVYVNDEKIELNELKFPQRDKYSLSYKYATNYSFEFEIPLDIEKEYEIKFKSDNLDLYVDFSRPCNFSTVVGYAKTKDYLSSLEGKCIKIKRKTTVGWIKKEFKTISGMLRKQEKGYKTGVPLRVMYII